MRKCIAMFFAFVLLISIIPANAFAEDNIEKEKLYSDDTTLAGAFTVSYGGDILGEMPGIDIRDKDRNRVSGTFTYPNLDNTRLGIWDLVWVFTPDDDKYETISGTMKVNIIISLNGTMADEDSEDETVPYFPATEIRLVPSTSYYIPINDNISGSTYTWTSSDKKIVTVNKKTGKIKAKALGTVTITCKIETPYDDTFELQAIVTVGDNNSSKTNKVITLAQKSTGYVNAPYNPEIATCRYTSSDKSIAYVDQLSGEIKARKPGTAYITCTIINLDCQVETQRYEVIVTK